MKKIVILITLLTSVLISSAVFAKSGSTCLSIGLQNDSNVSVNFGTDADPGYIPPVPAGQYYVLPGDSLVTCSGKKVITCTILIFPTDNSQSTTIHSVPLGTQITYNSPNNYYLNPNAKVPCGS